MNVKGNRICPVCGGTRGPNSKENHTACSKKLQKERAAKDAEKDAINGKPSRFGIMAQFDTKAPLA